MPKQLKKPCNHQGCPELTHKKYCDKHKYLNKNTRSKPYNSKWRLIRKRFLVANPFCLECYKNNKITPANEVHHIIPVNEGGIDNFDNLMALCKSCHSKITRRYLPLYRL